MYFLVVKWGYFQQFHDSSDQINLQFCTAHTQNYFVIHAHITTTFAAMRICTSDCCFTVDLFFGSTKNAPAPVSWNCLRLVPANHFQLVSLFVLWMNEWQFELGVEEHWYSWFEYGECTFVDSYPYRTFFWSCSCHGGSPEINACESCKHLEDQCRWWRRTTMLVICESAVSPRCFVPFGRLYQLHLSWCYRTGSLPVF